MSDATPVTVENVVETKPADGAAPVEKPTEKTTETSSKTVTSGAPIQPISTGFDDISRLLMTGAVLAVFGGFIETLLYQNKLTPEMITFILGSVAGWVSAAYMYSFGSSSGSKAADAERQVKNP